MRRYYTRACNFYYGKKSKNLVDKKNEELGWFDLGNHIIILGVILFAIFIAKNA